jgi:hypothetical protein
VHGRRIFALAGIGLLIVAVAVVGTIVSRGGDSSSEASNVPAAKKTIEVVVPEGYDRTQIAEVVKKAGLKGDYLKATESFKGFDMAKYGAGNAENLVGFLFPATYEVFKGAKVEDLVSKQLDAIVATSSFNARRRVALTTAHAHAAGLTQNKPAARRLLLRPRVPASRRLRSFAPPGPAFWLPEWRT